MLGKKKLFSSNKLKHMKMNFILKMKFISIKIFS